MPGQASDEVGGLSSADARIYELRDGGERIVLERTLDRRRADDARALAPGGLGKAPGDLDGAPANALLEALRQLAADRHRALGQRVGERVKARRQPPRRLERDRRVRPARELGPERGTRDLGP